MNKERDYIQDLAEIRSMMERSSKFMSLSGWSGVMAGIYALIGAYIAYNIYSFNPNVIDYSINSEDLSKVILIAVVVLIFTIGTAIFLSYNKAIKRGEKVWNLTSRLMIINLTVPLIAGGILITIFLSKELVGLIAPLTLLFYGLAMFNASKFTYNEMKYLGLIQMGLGLVSSYYIEYGLLFWAIGFGVVHIVYGIYMHLRYER